MRVLLTMFLMPILTAPLGQADWNDIKNIWDEQSEVRGKVTAISTTGDSYLSPDSEYVVSIKSEKTGEILRLRVCQGRHPSKDDLLFQERSENLRLAMSKGRAVRISYGGAFNKCIHRVTVFSKGSDSASAADSFVEL